MIGTRSYLVDLGTKPGTILHFISESPDLLYCISVVNHFSNWIPTVIYLQAGILGIVGVEISGENVPNLCGYFHE